MPIISQATRGTLLDRAPTTVDLGVACLWSVLGLLLTVLALVLGFGAEIGQVLAMTG